ncbi:MAG: VTT domain-containing protein [Myxococcota bacterium]|nr:VTT domain-containing protein [Myxococcota bacterium]MEC8424991.1 VTT domain-containing protein [Myxococcota bacterium]
MPEPARRQPPRHAWLRLCALTVLGSVLVWTWHTGTLSGVTLRSVQHEVSQAGPWGPLAYIGCFTLLQPLGVSAHLFLVVAGLAWPLPIALPVGYCGMMGAALTAFGLARWMGRDEVQRRLPRWLDRWDARLEQGGLRTVILIRLLFFTTFAVQLMLAVSKVRFRDYILGTAIGNLPVMVAVIVFSERVARWMGG